MAYKTAILILVVLLNTLFVAQAEEVAYPAVELTPTEVREDIALLQQALDELHPGTYRYADASVIGSAFYDEVWSDSATGMTDEQLYVAVSRIMAQVRCEHSKVEYSSAISRHRQAVTVHLPFRFRLFEERMFVVSASQRSELQPATEILSINGETVSDIIAELSLYVPIDGFTDHTIPEALADESDYINVGSAFEQYYPLVFGWTDEYEIEFLAPDATESETITTSGLSYEIWARLDFDNQTNRAEDFRDAVHFDYVGGGVGVLRIDTFVNYRRPVNYVELYEEVFADIAAINVEHLILDLRNNSGGSTDVAIGLLQFLMEDSFTLFDEVLRRSISVDDDMLQHLSSWDQSVLNVEPADYAERDNGFFSFIGEDITNAENQPHPNRFTGRLTALSSASNSSGSTVLLAHLQASGRATIVGEATGGSVAGPTAGVIAFLELPNSRIIVRIPVLLQNTGITPSEVGFGVIPDVVVPLTAEDYFSGVDTALETAQRL